LDIEGCDCVAAIKAVSRLWSRVHYIFVQFFAICETIIKFALFSPTHARNMEFSV